MSGCPKKGGDARHVVAHYFVVELALPVVSPAVFCFLKHSSLARSVFLFALFGAEAAGSDSAVARFAVEFGLNW